MPAYDFPSPTWNILALIPREYLRLIADVLVRLLALQYIEPLLTIAGAFAAWFSPGAAWFHHQLVPSLEPAPVALSNPRDKMAIWQLANC